MSRQKSSSIQLFQSALAQLDMRQKKYDSTYNQSFRPHCDPLFGASLLFHGL